MTKDTVFQSLLKPITKELIDECTKRFRSDYDCESFNTLIHLQTMIYAHIHELRSLRTLEVAINSQQIGIKSNINRSTLSDANSRRPADCFFWILQQLMSLLPRKMRQDVKKLVKILDSSPITLKGHGYDEWAKQHSTAHWQGLKLHIEYDLQLKSPTKVATSYANYNDSTMGQRWPIMADTIYVFDKGYCDFNWWWSIHQKRAYFVTRLKKNTAIVLEGQQPAKGENILEDGFFTFRNKSPRGGKKNAYIEKLRRISVARDKKEPIILVTNLHDLPADMIAALYKARWEIELFFKWIKQNLKIKKFLGKSANAVKIQLATALIAYLLVQLFKNNSGDKRTLQLILVWIKHNLNIKKPSLLKHDPPDYYFHKSLLRINKEGVHL
jgi:putative transposase